MRRELTSTVILASVILAALSTSIAQATKVPAPAKAAVQKGWTPIAVSARGVVIDRRYVPIDTMTFTVARFRHHSVAFHWHVGLLDPPGAASRLPADSAPRIMFASEGVVGVIAAFNGGFKQSAGAGGLVTDGVTLGELRNGMATAAIDVHGQLVIGSWGRDLPRKGFGAVTYRQNLPLLVDHGVVASSALYGPWRPWGVTVHGGGLVARTGLGVDAVGNVIYVATMSPVSAGELGRALVAAGATEAMELDINPDWPILGLAAQPIHSPAQHFGFMLPGSRHDPSIYETGWNRDFFTVLEEPGAWTCSIATAGITHPGQVTPQNPHFVGTNCPR